MEVTADIDLNRKSLDYLRQSYQALPVGKPRPHEMARFVEKVRFDPDPLRLFLDRDPRIATLNRRKGDGTYRKVDVLDPYIYTASHFELTDVICDLQPSGCGYGHHPFLNVSTGEYNGRKAEEMEEDQSSYAGYQYPAFIQRLADEMFASSLFPDRMVLKLDIRNFYQSIPHHLIDSILRRKAPIETFIQKTIADFHGYQSTGITVDTLCLHSAVLAGHVLLPLDRIIQEECPHVCFVRYVDDMYLIGRESDLLEVKSLIKRELRNRGLQLNEQKTLMMSVEQAQKMHGFDIHFLLKQGDLCSVADRLLTVERAPGNKLDACEKWMLSIASNKLAIDSQILSLISDKLGEINFIESLSDNQWRNAAILASREMTGVGLRNSLEALEEDSTYTICCVLDAFNTFRSTSRECERLFSIAYDKSRKHGCYELIKLRPSPPKYLN